MEIRLVHTAFRENGQKTTVGGPETGRFCLKSGQEASKIERIAPANSTA
jgi:hypothetical protein